ncbi:MAG: D-alanyl-D-alanine carboxypeptidase/D-alanyl-D-alanine-endopeptidase, partial [Actinobacteria bacterium]|nr:D-alanyl-D-alanine carboxypeptidase/D-alanyl-D-alanine-endopeptidase [Actinomycetota bacterium]
MARRERHHAARRVLHGLLVLVVLLAAVAAGVGVTAWRRSDPGPAPSPAEARLDLPPVVAPGDPSEVPATSGPAGSRVRAALAEALADPALGAHVTLAVAGGIGDPVLTEGRGPVVPASTTKLLTSLAALSLVDPGTTFDTTVVRSGSRVVLVGGGDPFLAGRPDPSAYPHRADLQTLAARTARALLADGVRQVRLGYDDSLFSGPALSPHWPEDYVADDVVSPISALWVDEGRLEPGGIERVADPALVAATDFAAALRTRGLRVAGPPVDATAPDSAERLARVSSAPIGEIVQQTLQASDNEAAEVLLRHVG